MHYTHWWYIYIHIFVFKCFQPSNFCGRIYQQNGPMLWGPCYPGGSTAEFPNPPFPNPDGAGRKMWMPFIRNHSGTAEEHKLLSAFFETNERCRSFWFEVHLNGPTVRDIILDSLTVLLIHQYHQALQTCWPSTAKTPKPGPSYLVVKEAISCQALIV